MFCSQFYQNFVDRNAQIFHLSSRLFNNYMSVWDNSTFGNGFEEIRLWERTMIIKIKKFKCFEEYCIITYF